MDRRSQIRKKKFSVFKEIKEIMTTKKDKQQLPQQQKRKTKHSETPKVLRNIWKKLFLKNNKKVKR